MCDGLAGETVKVGCVECELFPVAKLSKTVDRKRCTRQSLLRQVALVGFISRRQNFLIKSFDVASLLYYFSLACIDRYCGYQCLETEKDPAGDIRSSLAGDSGFCRYSCSCGGDCQVDGDAGHRAVWVCFIGAPVEFSPFMFFFLFLSFLGISFSMGMLLHSAFMYEDKNNMKGDSKKSWALCMIAGTGVTGWMFYYGYYMNFVR